MLNQIDKTTDTCVDETTLIVMRTEKEVGLYLQRILEQKIALATQEAKKKAQIEAERTIEEGRKKAKDIISSANDGATKVWDSLKNRLDKQSKEYRKQLIEEAQVKAKAIVNNAHEESNTIIDEAKQRAAQAAKILGSG
jgi:F0F1-type ATP synthase membrane subunit b/b'